MSHDLTAAAYEQIIGDQFAAWDIETNGLDPKTSKIGTCQLFSPTAGACVITEIHKPPPRLTALLEAREVTKVFHHAPFDLSFMAHKWGATPDSVVCTKIAAKLIAPEADPREYSLKHLMRLHFEIDLNKDMRFSDWMSASLSDEQLQYAVGDVRKLIDLYRLLHGTLDTMGLAQLYRECCDFLPTHVKLRLHGCPDPFRY
ncbi:ribonuclease D [Streptomyces sp. NPDC005811]|uniref:ribonuclease D n=1 Tax=Streptomyces sp. NPDC005811 TaxID=3154565 RepID=UPI0033CBFBE4